VAHITLLCSDLGRNALYTPWMFGGALAGRHEVEIVGPKPTSIWPAAKEEVTLAHTFAGPNPLRSGVRRDALAATEPADLLYAFKAHPASFGLGLWLRRKLDVRLALHLCDWDSGYFSGLPRARRWLYALRAPADPGNEVYLRLLDHRVRSADLVTVSTRALQRRFGGTVVRQGVDGRRFSPDRFPRAEARARLGIAADVPLIVFAGTPSLHKGLSELISAFRALPADLRGKLLIVGTPPDSESARVLQDNAGRGVECRPMVPFSEVGWYVAAADVACVPQRPTPFAEHQLPGKLLHWMALGACVLTTDVGDAGEILGGDSQAGRVVPPLDPAAMREALTGLLGDDTQRRRLGEAARARAERWYTWEAMARELDRLFKSIGVDG
jgi:glycosyltransferase involved in cell wall biosynthesis